MYVDSKWSNTKTYVWEYGSDTDLLHDVIYVLGNDTYSIQTWWNLKRFISNFWLE